MEEKTETPTEENSTSQRQALLNEIGRKLCEARELRGETVDSPARMLKLSKSNLLALESGNWDALPDEVYALGFLRQYSKYLQIDIDPELELFKSDQHKLTKPLTFPDPAVAPSRNWAWIAGLAFILLMILFNILNSNNTEYEFSNDTQTSSEPGMDHAIETPQQTDAESMSDDTPMIDPAKTEEAVNSTEKVEKTAGNRSTGRESKKQSAPASKTHTYRFEAVGGDVWLQVYVADGSGLSKGKLHKEALLKDGHYAIVTVASESLWITCGNAPALQIKVDGKTVAETGSLSSGKKILRDYRFTIKGR